MTHGFNPKSLGLALAIVSGTAYIVCALLFAIAPASTLNFFSALFHGIDITPIAGTTVPLSTAVLGFFESVILAFVLGWFFAKVYNYIAG